MSVTLGFSFCKQEKKLKVSENKLLRKIPGLAGKNNEGIYYRVYSQLDYYAYLQLSTRRSALKK
jgi:hypothetical protein